MKRSFLTQLAAVLAQEPHIDGLGNGDLLAPTIDGEVVPLPPENETVQRALIRIARLYTLICRENETSQPPSFPAMETGAALLGQSTSEALAAALGVREDSVRRMKTLEGLIVEAVRELVPSEAERLGFTYRLRPDHSLVRVLARSHRTLD